MQGIIEIIRWEENGMVLAGTAENGEEALNIIRNDVRI
jgi:YesN/AraC family two-component response regulator